MPNINVRIPEDIDAKLNKLTDQKTGKYLTKSEIIRQALVEYLKNHHPEV